jgi:hypothetical protein
MSQREFHVFQRPDVTPTEPAIGEPWSADYNLFDEGVRYVYRQGAHELTLFWRGPTLGERQGLMQAPVQAGLFSHGPAAFLLYKIENVCEWSDAAFNAHLAPEMQIPQEAAGDRARLKITLVDAETGLVAARRIVSLDKVMTQAMKHVLKEQSSAPFNRLLYDAAVQEVHGRYADTDALVQVAEVVEPCLG